MPGNVQLLISMLRAFQDADGVLDIRSFWKSLYRADYRPLAEKCRRAESAECHTSSEQCISLTMIRDTLSKLKAWFSSDVTIDAAKPVGKDKSQAGPAYVRPAESAKKAKRRAQRQARARNR
jgi:hypothetical protein